MLNILAETATVLSIEDQLSTIEEQYQKAYDIFVLMYSSSTYHTSENMNEALKTAIRFQCSCELLLEDLKKLSDAKTKYYVDRSIGCVSGIAFYIRGKSSYIGACGYLDQYDYDHAFHQFAKARSLMYGFLEDVRLVYALRLYPIEEKMALKSKLTDYGLLDVTKCLEEAEVLIAEKHFKDCIDRSREALEKTAAGVLVLEKKTPSGYFATDIGTLNSLHVVDKESKKLIEATYSYLSVVGAHGRGGELTLGDAHYAMKETYMRIDILLKKYEAHLTVKA